MGNQKSNKNLKFLKVFLIVLTILVGAQLLGRFMLTTTVVHNFVKGKIISLANEGLNAKLEIEKLEGDLWEEILLTNISVKGENPIFLADTLYSNYNIWSFLKGPYEINTIKLVGVHSFINEEKDSIFNIQQVVKADTLSSDIEEESEPFKIKISQFQLENVNTTIFSPSYLPDSVLKIKGLWANASFQKTNTLEAVLSSLSFSIEEGRLPAAIKVKTSGKLLEQQITLEEMVLETGRSMLKARAQASLQDSVLSAEVSTLPFSLADIQPYLEAELPADNLNLEVSVSGSLNKITIKVNLDHQYASNIELTAGFDFQDVPTLTQFEIYGDGLDIAHFTNDSVDAQLGNFNGTLSGSLNNDIPSANIIWEFMFSGIRFEEYAIDRLVGNGTLKEDNFSGLIKVNPHLREQISSKVTIQGVSSNEPNWRVNFNVDEFDASNWADVGDMESKISLLGYVEGQSFSLGQKPWKYLVYSYPSQQSQENKRTQISGQYFNAFELKGDVSEDVFKSEGYITFDDSRIDFEFDAEDIFEEIPKYDYFITADNFDLSEISQTADFPTALNMDIYGEGRGINPEDSFIFATLNIDSSIVNGSEFENLDAAITFSNGVLSISNGILRSDIIEGNFSGRKNITDQTDPENWLIVDMLVKNIQPLAPLVNVERLSATGEIKGRVTQDTSKILRGNMQLDFEDIVVDTMFIASRISGKTEVTMNELRHFNLNLSIESPIISGITFQDIELVSEGYANADTLHSNFDLDIIGSDRGKLIQEGSLRINFLDELVDIKFNRFNFVTLESELALQHPFNVRIQKESISTDTLDLQSNLGAFLKLSIPYADSVEQYGWFSGDNFDFGIIQEVVFGERFIDGVLSGETFFNRSAEDVTGSGAFSLTRIKYGEIEADSLDLTFDVRNERLFAKTSINWDQKEKVVGNISVPFIIKDASELGDDFFDQQVEGSLRINPSQITRFKALLDEFGISDTDGILSFNGTMSGTAGSPVFAGEFLINEPVLSGIRVDTVSANFRYDNTRNGLLVQTQIIAAKQKAAEVELIYPFEYDFKTYRVILPDEEEIIRVTAKTENFNIAVFNDFLDKEYLTDLRGTLNADLSLQGPSDNMVPKGYLRLSDARVSVPVAGITLDGIKSDVEFTQNGLNVKEITAKSGRGSFNASGAVQLEGITPKTINLTARANQFRLANTDDQNIVIDLNGKLSGNALTPKVTGKLTVRNGFVYLNEFGENTIEEVQLDGEELSSFSPYDSLEIDMVFEIQRDFYVRNRTYLDMEIELVGSLDAQKDTKGELSLFGNLNGIEGYVRPLGKTFKMENANFTFSGPIDNPDLSIKSKYTPPTRQKGESVELYYLIEGTAQAPEFSFDSNPPMEQSDIVCYTLFGKPCYSLESWQSVFTSGGSPSATDVLTDVLLDEVEALATRELGVDVVQIDNTGTSGGTSIKTGWYINQRTFFAIVNELTGSTPKTLFMLEYILSENWDLIVTQGGDTRRGIDFRYQFDY
tara:strand:- start:10004 stop:14497 length:4494 start_codon:yes stop_codon:yes gene_type:complete